MASRSQAGFPTCAKGFRRIARRRGRVSRGTLKRPRLIGARAVERREGRREANRSINVKHLKEHKSELTMAAASRRSGQAG